MRGSTGHDAHQPSAPPQLLAAGPGCTHLHKRTEGLTVIVCSIQIAKSKRCKHHPHTYCNICNSVLKLQATKHCYLFPDLGTCFFPGYLQKTTGSHSFGSSYVEPITQLPYRAGVAAPCRPRLKILSHYSPHAAAAHCPVRAYLSLRHRLEELVGARCCGGFGGAGPASKRFLVRTLGPSNFLE